MCAPLTVKVPPPPETMPDVVVPSPQLIVAAKSPAPLIVSVSVKVATSPLNTWLAFGLIVSPCPVRWSSSATAIDPLAVAWALSDGRVTLPLPVVLIGMDTPQVTPALLAAAAEPLVSRTADATFGMAEDGGFWLLGLRRPDRSLVTGIPGTAAGGAPAAGAGRLLLNRLASAGLRVALAPRLDIGVLSSQATGPVTVTRVP